MAKGLNALRVSLTKNGYFKVAEVIKKHPRDEILANLRGTYPDINLDAAQIQAMLSYNAIDGEFPEYWDDVRNFGDEAVEALVFISIVFSHTKLIKTLSNSKTSEMRGCIARSSLGDKVYTNLVYSMAQLNMCPIGRGAEETNYDTSPLFLLKIGPLVKKVLRDKIKMTGWSEPRSDDYFSRDFYEQCFYYHFEDVLAISKEQLKQWLEGEHVELEEPPKLKASNKSIITSANLVSAIATKGFTILAGTTGTGKTKTIRELVIALNQVPSDPEFNLAFIAVEAGWTDARHIIGYKNPFGQGGESYVSTKLIEILLKANYPEYAAVPFFVILDEMNLSHVEMYFSTFLSIMETSQDDRPVPILNIDELKLLYKSELTSSVQASYIVNAIKNGGLYMSKNVFIVGTVNMDETTYSFSPKVLDRSFVIEYFPQMPSTVGDKFEIPASDKLEGDDSEISSLLTSGHATTIDKSIDTVLDRIFKRLGSFKFGPRTTNEIRRYLAVIKVIAGSSLKTLPEFVDEKHVVDRILVQKVLPKISGRRESMLPLIKSLEEIATEADYPLAHSKLEDMKNAAILDGFANYFV